MSELRQLAVAAEYLFKEVCKLKSAPSLHLDSVKGPLGKALSQLARAAAEQEALSPASNADRFNPEKYMDKYPGYKPALTQDELGTPIPKGSSVEYYRDRLVELIIEWFRPGNAVCHNNFKRAISEYQAALSASPDPEGEWMWVPSTCAVVPLEPTDEMINRGKNELEVGCYTKRGSALFSYNAMLAARPPVPKKGERG